MRYCLAVSLCLVLLPITIQAGEFRDTDTHHVWITDGTNDQEELQEAIGGRLGAEKA